MDDLTQQQIAELVELRDAHEKRLRVLVLQRAQLGSETPTSVLIEIKDIQQVVFGITAKLAELQIAESRIVERETRAQNTQELQDVSRQVTDASHATNAELRRLSELMLRIQGADFAQRRRRQRLTIAFYVVITLLLLAILYGIVSR